jgi:hypothetical protein
VTGTGPGEFPVVTFSVTDPTNNDAPYDIHADAPFTTCAGGASRLSVNVAWSTTDYTNAGSGVLPGLPIQMNPLTACGGASTAVGDGSFTVTSTTAIPLTAVGSAAATIEGHPAVDADNDGNVDRIAVTNAVAYAPITDATAAPRRAVVDIEKCDDCHNQLSVHGNNRTDKPEVCVTCHNPNMTDINQRAPVTVPDVPPTDCLNVLGADDQTIDMHPERSACRLTFAVSGIVCTRLTTSIRAESITVKVATWLIPTIQWMQRRCLARRSTLMIRRPRLTISSFHQTHRCALLAMSRRWTYSIWN